LIVPLSTERFIRWLVGEIGSPPVRGPPVLRPEVAAPREAVMSAASLGWAAVVTSPNAVDVLSSGLPRPLLLRALSRTIAIGPMTAEAVRDAVPGASIRVPESHDSGSLISSLAGGERYVLWCSDRVDPALSAAVEGSGGVVVRLYGLKVDARAADEIRRSLAPGDLLVFASASSVEAWRRVGDGLDVRVRAATISGRVTRALGYDPRISSLSTFGGGDMRKFPQFLREAYGAGRGNED